jgi:hypothetical protein
MINGMRYAYENIKAIKTIAHGAKDTAFSE